MNYSPTAQRILFYGDSYVYGKVSGENRRLAANERFTGRLQELLGDGVEVIEEGLRGRMLAGENQFFPERDGLQQFGPIIASHLPVDTLIIFLGTNDCNAGGDVSAERVRAVYKQYLDKLTFWANFLAVSEPKVILMSPPTLREEYFDEGMFKVFGAGAAARSAQLPAIIKDCADQLGVGYFDCAPTCSPAEGDGIHLSLEANDALAEALYAVLAPSHP